MCARVTWVWVIPKGGCCGGGVAWGGGGVLVDSAVIGSRSGTVSRICWGWAGDRQYQLYIAWY